MYNGNFGDYKTIDAKLSELRFFFGGGIRMYFTIRNQHVIFLLSGGDKSNQTNDVDKAREILKKLGRLIMVIETTAPFNIDEYLETEEDIRDFLKGTLETGSISDFINALNIAARASLYKTLSEEGNPEFDTIVKVLKSLGCRFSLVADMPSVCESVENAETVADDRATVC